MGNYENSKQLNLSDPDKSKLALELCWDSYEREFERINQIERKSETLLGFTGIVTSIFFSGITLLIRDYSEFSLLSKVLFIVFLLLILLFLSFSIINATKVIAVGEYKFSYLNHNDVYDWPNINIENIKEEQIISLIKSIDNQSDIANKKASHLIKSQKWFRNSIIILIIASLLISFSFIFDSRNDETLSTPTCDVLYQIQIMSPTLQNSNSIKTIASTSTMLTDQTKTPSPIKSTTLTPTQSQTKEIFNTSMP